MTDTKHLKNTELKMKRMREARRILNDFNHNRQNYLLRTFLAPSPIFLSLWHLLG